MFNPAPETPCLTHDARPMLLQADLRQVILRQSKRRVPRRGFVIVFSQYTRALCPSIALRQQHGRMPRSDQTPVSFLAAAPLAVYSCASAQQFCSALAVLLRQFFGSFNQRLPPTLYHRHAQTPQTAGLTRFDDDR